jgi:cell volume regulation protein A
MSLLIAAARARHYAFMAFLLVGGWFAAHRFSGIIDTVIAEAGAEEQTILVLSGIVCVFTLGFVVCEVAKPTIFPSFVVAIFFGIATRDVFSFLTSNTLVVSTLIHVGAVLILFGGGLETPFRKFRDLVGPIFSLALFGTIFNAFLFSALLISIAPLLGIAIPLPAAVLLGAALASTDPAAIIPSIQSLFFVRPTVKHIAISESAINDVVGAVLVGIFLAIFQGGQVFYSILQAYTMLFSLQNLELLLKTLAIGGVVGLGGFGILSAWDKWKTTRMSSDEGDSALFLSVPLLVFTTATLLGGSGFLASFLSSLLFQLRSHIRHVEHYFHHTVEDFMKPILFILLGAMVDPQALWNVAPLGLLMGTLFILVLRPLIVFITLWPFCFGRNCLHFRELVFLCFVRETGVIPAALLLTIFLQGVAGGGTIMAIGLWVILLTLIVEPPLTPALARWLGLAGKQGDVLPRKHSGPVVVLCSRGYSYKERLQTVTEWSQQHSVEHVVLLHCPEDKYTQEFMHEVRDEAMKQFRMINTRLVNEGKRELTFEFLGGPGLLQDHIESLVQSGDVSIVFVGTKMLDFRIDDIKRMQVPFYFMP